MRATTFTFHGDLMDPQEGDIADLPDGRTATFSGGRWIVQDGGASSPAPSGGGYSIVPMTTPAERRAMEDQQFQREDRAWERQREEAALGIDMARLQLAQEQAGLRGNRYQNKFDEARATRDATRFDAAMTGWADAAGLEAGGQRAERLLEDAPVGAFADQRIAAGRVAGDFLGWLPGIPTRQQTQQLEQLRLLGSQGALGDVSQLKGPLSEKELAFIQRLQIDPNATRETNMQVAEAMQWAARRQAAYGAAMERWVQELGSPSAPNANGLSFNAWWGQYASRALPRPGSPEAAARQEPEDAVPLAGSGAEGGDAAPGAGPTGPVDISGMSAAELLQLQPGTEIRLPDGTVTRLTGAPSEGAQGEQVAPGVFTREAQSPEDAVAERRALGNGLFGGDARAEGGVGGLVRGDTRAAPSLGRRASAFAEGMADTISFGLDDEFSAAANAVLPMDDRQSSIWQGKSFGDAYRENVDRYRAIDAADMEDVPVTRAAGQVTGGLVGGAGAVRAVPAVGRFAAGGGTRLARAGRGAGVGAAYGGAYGFGSGEGNALERLDDAAIGGAIGAGAGVAAPVAVNVGQRIVSPVANALADGARYAVGRPLVNALGERAPAALRNVVEVNPLARAAERFAGTNQPNINALRAEQARLEADVGRAVPAAAVINTGGRSLLRGVAMRSDAARQIAEDFGEGTAEALPGRMSQQARRIVSSDNRSPDQIRADLTNRRSNLAREEYREPYAQPVQIGEDIGRALSGAPGRAAIQRARAAAEAWQDDAVMAELDALQAAVAAGEPLPPVSAGAVDRIRQALSGRGERLAQNPATRAVGAGVQNRAGRVDAALDNVEGLGPARQTYRDLSQQIEAVDLGARALNANPDEVIAGMAGASPEAQAAFRAGLARNIETAAGNTTTAPGIANRLAIPNTPTRQVMDETLGPDDADRLARAARGERDINRRAQRVNPGAGSPTAQNDRDFARAAGVGGDIMSGRFGSAALRIVDRVRRRGFNDAQAEALLEAMIDPRRTNEVIDLLAQRMNRREARRLARAIRYQLTTGPQSGRQE